MKRGGKDDNKRSVFGSDNMIQIWPIMNKIMPIELSEATNIVSNKIIYHHPRLKPNALAMIFKCQLEGNGRLEIFINKNEAEADSTPPHYVARIFINKAMVSYVMGNAAEITQTASQAEEVVIKWSGNNYTARFNYNTDWAPKLTPFATFRVTYASHTLIYNCMSSRIDILQVPTWDSIHRGDNISNVFSIWSLSDFGLAARLPDDSE